MELFSWIFAGIVFAGIVWAGLSTDILREKKKNTGLTPPISFSRWQLWLWTLIIIPCFIIYWGHIEDHKPYLNYTGIVLLGISMGTTFSSAVITAVQEVSVNRPLKLKMDQESRSWWRDLLMDDFGQFSVTRLQQLIFTVVFILIYVITFCRNNFVDYPEFHEQALYLMGISAGGYLLGKGGYK